MTPEAETATGFSPSAPLCEACDIIMAKASKAAEQTWEMPLDMGLSVGVNASANGPSLDASLGAGLRRLKCRCGIGSMALGYEAGREQRAERQRDADAGHACRPAEAIEDLAQHGAAGQAAQELARA